MLCLFRDARPDECQLQSAAGSLPHSSRTKRYPDDPGLVADNLIWIYFVLRRTVRHRVERGETSSTVRYKFKF